MGFKYRVKRGDGWESCDYQSKDKTSFELSSLDQLRNVTCGRDDKRQSSHGLDPGVQAVSPSFHCGRLPLLSIRPVVTFPAEERHCLSTGTKLYCLVIKEHRCEQLAQGCYAASSCWELNPQPIDRKSNALPLHHCATHNGEQSKK